LKQWFAFWTLGLIWGSSFLLIKIAVDDLGVFPLVAIRLAIAGICMFIYLWTTGRRFPTSRKDQLGLVFVAIANLVIPFMLITSAEEKIDSSLATILNSTVPLFSLVIANFMLPDEKLNQSKVFGLIIGYVGILVLAWRGITENSSLLGQAMMVGAAISYAGAIIFIRAQLRHIEPILVAGSTLVIAALVSAPLALLASDLPDLDAVNTDAIAAVVTLGIVNTLIAYFLFYYLIDQWGARATMVAYTFPPVGITLGWLVLGEDVDIRLILGAALILTGIIAVNYKRKTPRLSVIKKAGENPAS
jgi:drug/metabolite transporter (DMT)-like permease